jgi:hypothetical protein
MPMFTYKAFRRERSAPLWPMPEQTYSFEAPCEDTARAAAYFRVAKLPPDCVAVLYDGDGNQVWSGHSRTPEAVSAILPG